MLSICIFKAANYTSNRASESSIEPQVAFSVFQSLLPPTNNGLKKKIPRDSSISSIYNK